ncbi:hypothetical protein QYF36_015704 [Acer negundo]|nr:hypothetical protein QYF36_015704 [Acer negundo]
MREKPLVLVNNHPPPKENDDEGESTISNTRSESVAVNVWPDLLSSFEIVRNKMESKEFDKGKLAMVARFGKILFHGSPSIGVDLVEEKNIYHIKLSDKTQPGSALICKCGIKEDKKLELHKVKLKPIRQMVVDVSCIDKNLDLRLALYTKRTISALTDNEMHSIRNIVDSSILDPEVKGGLRWPFGKASSTSDREATFEVALKLRRMVSDLQEEKVETDSIFDMFKGNLRMIWDHFLCYDQYFP